MNSGVGNSWERAVERPPETAPPLPAVLRVLAAGRPPAGEEASAKRPRRRRVTALGVVLVVVGVGLILAAIFLQLAHALPLAELPGHPRSIPGVACAVAGSALVLASRPKRGRSRGHAARSGTRRTRTTR
jgi:hypothetical protein